MSSGQKKAVEAVFRFVRHASVCSEWREAFSGPNFDKAFPDYYGRHAIAPDDRGRLRDLMNDSAVLDAMKNINEGLHRHDLKAQARKCNDTDWVHKPYRFWSTLTLGLVLSASAAAVLYDASARGWPALLSTSGALSLAGGLAVLWDAFSYEAL